jgi:hypothetical protein
MTAADELKRIDGYMGGRIPYHWVEQRDGKAAFFIGSMHIGSASFDGATELWSWRSQFFSIPPHASHKSLAKLTMDVERAAGVRHVEPPLTMVVREAADVAQRWLQTYVMQFADAQPIKSADAESLAIAMYGAMDMETRANQQTSLRLSVDMTVESLAKQIGVSEAALLSHIGQANKTRVRSEKGAA